MVLLTSCAKTNYKSVTPLNLPDMPIAGSKVADELATQCNKQQCPNVTNWLNELYLFRQQYSIYKEELKK